MIHQQAGKSPIVAKTPKEKITFYLIANSFRHFHHKEGITFYDSSQCLLIETVGTEIFKTLFRLAREKSDKRRNIILGCQRENITIRR